MIMKYYISLLIALTFIFSAAAQDDKQMKKVQTENIEKIKIQDREIMNNFLLFAENLFKPNEQATAQIRKYWKRDTAGSDLKLIEEETLELGESIGASCTQKWYRSEKKEKIEVDIILCPPSKIEIDKTIEVFTKKMYSIQFNQTNIPLVGEISWIANNPDTEIVSYVIMFLRANVFVRIYVSLKDKNVDELKATAINLANNIDTKILSEF